MEDPNGERGMRATHLLVWTHQPVPTFCFDDDTLMDKRRLFHWRCCCNQVAFVGTSQWSDNVTVFRIGTTRSLFRRQRIVFECAIAGHPHNKSRHTCCLNGGQFETAIQNGDFIRL